MNVYDQVKLYLHENPQGRERVNKNRAIANILNRKYRICKGVDFVPAPLTRDLFTEIVGEVGNYDRAWRKVLEEHPTLRGTDYYQKTELARKKQLELGYDV